MQVVRKIDQERRQAAVDALAPNTRRSYDSAVRQWWLYALAAGIDDPGQPSPSQLRQYLIARNEAGAGISSLQKTVSALRHYQKSAGCDPTASDPIIADTLTAVARDQRPPRQVQALTAAALTSIAATATLPRKTGRGRESQELARKRGLVDVALCRLMSDAGLRRAEAAALLWADLEVWEDRSGRLTIRRSKTDNMPRTVYVTPATVKALSAMVPPGAVPEDSIFGLSAASISRRIRAAAAAAGLGPGYSGHSGRVGMARRMAKAGAPTHEIMAQGRWKSAVMVGTYTRAEEAGRAARWLD